jgi:hypothetical protein
MALCIDQGRVPDRRKSIGELVRRIEANRCIFFENARRLRAGKRQVCRVAAQTRRPDSAYADGVFVLESASASPCLGRNEIFLCPRKLITIVTTIIMAAAR